MIASGAADMTSMRRERQIVISSSVGGQGTVEEAAEEADRRDAPETGRARLRVAG